jgi:hypothetical protein
MSYVSRIQRATSASMKLVAMSLVLALGTLTMTPSAWSQDGSSSTSTEGGNATSAGMGAAAGLLTIPYVVCKSAFALGGGIVGGLAYVFSGGNSDAAKSIWTTSMYGTYFITPDHLRGDKPIRFLGVAEQSAPTMEPVR